MGIVVLWLGWHQQNTAQEILDRQIGQMLSDGAKEEQARSILKAIDGVQATTDETLALVNNFTSHSDSLYLAKPSSTKTQTRLRRVESKSVFSQLLPSGERLTQLVFRDGENRVLRDIEINLTFDNPILSASYRFSGAVVIDQNSLIALKDSTRLIFRTGYLSPSNDIYISIISRDSLSIQENLKP